MVVWNVDTYGDSVIVKCLDDCLETEVNTANNHIIHYFIYFII